MGNGVQIYGVATMTVYFPGGVVCCKSCQFAHKDSLGRPCCWITNLVINDPNEINYGCPMKIVATNQTNNFEDV